MKVNDVILWQVDISLMDLAVFYVFFSFKIFRQSKLNVKNLFQGHVFKV